MSITNSIIAQPDVIEQALHLLFQPGDVIELRCPKTRKGTVSGYFNDMEKLAQVAANLSGKVPGVYVTLNPVNPALLARSANKVRAYAKETTADSDIIARRWLPIDFDPVRPAGISSTDAEHELALERARQARKWLRELGWPEPIFADSGNGAHLLYRVDLADCVDPQHGSDFFRQILDAVAFHYNGDGTEVDQKVFNLARIWKLYGTLSCKGDNLPDRPHRLAKLLEVPEVTEPIPLLLLEKVAAMQPSTKVLTHEGERRKNTHEGFDLEAWIKEHDLPVVSEAPWAGGKKWILNPCPWNPEHTNKAAYIVQFGNGAIAAGCHHNGCTGKDWHALRDLYEPGWRDMQCKQSGLGTAVGAAAVEPVVVRLADVEPEDVTWLWEPYIPLGKLTILEGDPGVGKTWLALQLAAIVSRGDPFPGPDGIPRDRQEPATVVYMTAEDGLADTLRPRLDKAGADVNKVFALTGWENNDPETGEKRTGGVTLADLGIIETTLKQVKPVLLVVDPLQAYLGAGVDMHRANEVRPILAGLAALAEKYKCAVLCIRHLGKSQQDKSIYRGLGSIDFSAAARSVLLVGKDPNSPKKRILAQHKCSLAAEGTSIAFELREDGFFWCGLSDVTAEALLAPAKTEEEKTALEEAIDFLQETLADGPVDSKHILKEARKAGIAERTLHRAKASLSVASQKIGKAWVWNLAMDDVDDESYKDTSDGNLGNVDLQLTPPMDSGHDSTLPRGKLDLYPESLLPQDLEGRLPTLPSRIPLGGDSQDGQDGDLNREVFDV